MGVQIITSVIFIVSDLAVISESDLPSPSLFHQLSSPVEGLVLRVLFHIQ